MVFRDYYDVFWGVPFCDVFGFCDFLLFCFSGTGSHFLPLIGLELAGLDRP